MWILWEVSNQLAALRVIQIDSHSTLVTQSRSSKFCYFLLKTFVVKEAKDFLCNYNTKVFK
jgi:hypothetical protein